MKGNDMPAPFGTRDSFDESRSRHDALRDENIVQTCEQIEAEHIIRDRDQAEITRLASRPYRVIHELPRKHTTNGYAFDA